MSLFGGWCHLARCARPVGSALPGQPDGDVVLALRIMRPRADVVGDDVDDVVERLVRVLNQEIFALNSNRMPISTTGTTPTNA